jgi:hypothetical protein
MSKLKDLLQKDTTSALIQTKFDEFFRINNDKRPDRSGLHASSIIAPDTDFCYREHVLGFFYKRNKTFIAPSTLRIFLNGWYVHIKWQDLFKSMGIAESVERTRRSNLWDVYLTPDAIVKLFGKRYVVEIKSANSYAFNGMKTPHAGAIRQANFYMFCTGIPRAIILVEDKNTQNIKVWVVEFDPDIARPFVKRLHNIKRFVKLFKQENKLPKKLCSGASCKRAGNCPMKEACWASKSEREEMAI